MRASAHYTGAIRSAILGAVLAFCALPASAALISGDLTFSGDFEISGPLSTATSLTLPGNDFDVDGSNGDFGGINQGDIGSIADFDLSGPILFDIAGFAFNIDSVQIVAQTDGFLLLTGSGNATAAGFDTTAVDFTLTANVSGPIKNFSAGVTAVPVPGALLLFGSALAALGWRKR